MTDKVEVVVTIPKELAPGLLVPTATRTTLGVLVELVAASEERIILASPFLQLSSVVCKGPLGLALASASRRGVLIDVVCMSGSLRDEDTSALLTNRVEMAVRVFQPKANLIDSDVMGSHAKFCLVDGRAAYVGSANFTENGLTKHFELGTLIRGQPAKDLFSVVGRLFNEGFFVQRGWLQVMSQDPN